MDRVTSTEFQREFGRTMSNAKRHPVTITNRGRDEWVLIDAAEFERLKKLDTRRAFYAWEMEQADIDAIATAQPSAEAEKLNHLLELSP